MAVRKPDIEAANTHPDPSSQPSEVRAGPGDAGRADKPKELPHLPQEKRKGRQAIGLLAGLLALGVVVYILMQVAA